MTKSNFRILRPFLTVAALIGAVALSGCSGGGPAKTAQTYVDNLKLYNYPACYQALSHQDQIDKTMDDFLTAIPLAPDVSRDWFKGILGAQEFVVGDVKQEGDDKAVVTVKVTRPDLALWERTIDATTDPNSGPDQAAQKSLGDKSFPKVTYDDDIVAVKEGSEQLLEDSL